MFHLNPASAYFWFALWTALVWCLTYVFLPQSRPAQMWMSKWGLIGGPLINLVYQTDFWQPIGIIPYVPIESAVFGAGFLGVVTAVTLDMMGGVLYPEKERSIQRATKILTLVATVISGLVVYLLRFNSVFATAVGLSVGAGLMVLYRRDLWQNLAKGVAASLLTYLVIVGAFVMLLTGNTHALGRELSSFYSARGAGATAVLLTLWAAAFGAFFGPFYPWVKNLHRIKFD